MATVATLTIDLVGQSGKLRTELARANKSTKGWADKTRQQVNSVGKVFAATAAIGAGALSAVYVNAANDADKLAKESDKLGILPERLTGIQFAGQQTGVAIETTNKALQKMTDVVADAKRGVGEGAEALKTLNINVEDLARLSPDKQFSVIAESMKGVANQNDRLNIAIDLFGQRGAGLVNTLALGADGLNAMQLEAEALGVTLNRVDLAKIEKANDDFNRAKLTTSAFGKALAAEVSPFVAALSNQFVESAKEAGGFGVIASAGVEKVVTVVSFAADAVHGLSVVWTGVKAAATTAVSIMVGNIAFLDRALTGFLNSLPGVTATVNDSLQSSASSLSESGAAAREAFSKALLEPLPGESVRAWVEDVQQKATAAAQEVAANSSGSVAAGIEIPLTVGEAANDPEFTALKARLGGEEELIKATYEKRRQIVFDNTVAGGEEQLELIQSLNQQEYEETNRHLASLGNLEAKWKNAQLKFDKATGIGKVKILTGGLAQMSAASAQHSKKMFKLNKLAAIADATVSVAQGVAAGVKLGWPAGIPAVAWALATGLPQIAAIKGTSFSGGGTGTTPSAAASSPVINDFPTQSTPTATNLTSANERTDAKQEIHLHIGELTSNDPEKWLNDVKSIINDSDFVLIEADSRNGLELTA